MLQSELENFKVAQEREKAMVAELRFNATRAANKYASLLQELQRKCSTLERQAQTSGQAVPNESGTSDQAENSAEAVQDGSNKAQGMVVGIVAVVLFTG